MMSMQNQEIQKNEPSQASLIGLKILQKLQQDGINIPPPSALKKKNTSRASKLESQESIRSSKDDINNLKVKLGTNFRNQVESVHQAKVAAERKQVEKKRAEDVMIVAGRKDGYSNKLKPIYEYDERLKIMTEVN